MNLWRLLGDRAGGRGEEDLFLVFHFVPFCSFWGGSSFKDCRVEGQRRSVDRSSPWSCTRCEEQVRMLGHGKQKGKTRFFAFREAFQKVGMSCFQA